MILHDDDEVDDVLVDAALQILCQRIRAKVTEIPLLARVASRDMTSQNKTPFLSLLFWRHRYRPRANNTTDALVAHDEI